MLYGLVSSPRGRGSAADRLPRGVPTLVLPAPAGVSRRPATTAPTLVGSPRARGG
ncbi:hypothetical protein KPATCC21470_1050 [Kitasatospora purpeofusca]